MGAPVAGSVAVCGFCAEPSAPAGSVAGRGGEPGFWFSCSVEVRSRSEGSIPSERASRTTVQAASSTTTGTWSEGFSFARTCLSMRARSSRSAAWGERSAKSMRMPMFRCQAPAW